MKYRLVILILMIAANSSLAQSSVQGTIVSAYNESTNDQYSTQWVIGELINETFKTNNFTVSSGLNATNNFITEIGGPETIGGYRMLASPNPFSTTLTLTSEEIPLNQASFSFHTAAGIELHPPILELQQKNATFSTENLSSGFYILSIKIKRNIVTHLKVVRE